MKGNGEEIMYKSVDIVVVDEHDRNLFVVWN